MLSCPTSRQDLLEKARCFKMSQPQELVADTKTGRNSMHLDHLQFCVQRASESESDRNMIYAFGLGVEAAKEDQNENLNDANKAPSHLPKAKRVLRHALTFRLQTNNSTAMRLPGVGFRMFQTLLNSLRRFGFFNSSQPASTHGCIMRHHVPSGGLSHPGAFSCHHRFSWLLGRGSSLEW